MMDRYLEDYFAEKYWRDRAVDSYLRSIRRRRESDRERYNKLTSIGLIIIFVTLLVYGLLGGF